MAVPTGAAILFCWALHPQTIRAVQRLPNSPKL